MITLFHSSAARLLLGLTRHAIRPPYTVYAGKELMGGSCRLTRCLHRERGQQAVREAATICPTPCKLTLDLLTLKVMSESRVTWPTSVPILAFLDLSVLDLGPMYATDRRQTRIIA